MRGSRSLDREILEVTPQADYENQLVDPKYRQYECEGERKLLMSVIRMAKHDYTCRDRLNRSINVTCKDFASAKVFLFSDKLETYCNMLGLDADSVRTRLE